MRTVGVEEELLVVDAESGRPVSVADRVLRRAEPSDAGDGQGEPGEPGGSIGAELQRQQVETDTPPRADLCELETDLQVARAVRGSVGEEVVLMSDYNQSLSVAEASRRAAALEDEGLYWIEEPTRADDYSGHARIRRDAHHCFKLIGDFRERSR